MIALHFFKVYADDAMIRRWKDAMFAKLRTGLAQSQRRA